jgi:hypothetical protein
VGDGPHTLFWMDRWLNGCSIRQLSPELWNVVPPRIRNSRTVKDTLLGRRWIRDIVFARTVFLLVQYLHLWDALRKFYLSDQPDRFIWKWSPTGEFTSSSAYRALFPGRTPVAGAERIWKIQAPGRCRFFGWLVLHGRCWTSHRLRRHGLQDSDDCALCAQEVETLDHLLLGCVHNREMWFRVLRYYGLQHLTPQEELPFLSGGWLSGNRFISSSAKFLILWLCWSSGRCGRSGIGGFMTEPHFSPLRLRH